MTRTSETILYEPGKIGNLCLARDFRGNTFNFSLLRMMLVVALLYMAFIILRNLSSIDIFWSVFNNKSMLNFVKSFFYIYRDDHMLSILYFVNVVYHID